HSAVPVYGFSGIGHRSRRMHEKMVDHLGGEVGQDQSACRIMNAGGNRDDACAKTNLWASDDVNLANFTIRCRTIRRQLHQSWSIRGKDGWPDELRVLGLSLGRGLTRHPA